MGVLVDGCAHAENVDLPLPIESSPVEIYSIADDID